VADDTGAVTEVEAVPVTGQPAEPADSVDAEPVGTASASRGLALPLVPALAVLLVLLVAGCVALWVTRPDGSAVRTDDYVGALQAARSGIVDVASFDYVTLDDDIAQIRTVTTGELQQESVDQLDQRRQQITDAQAVVNTTVVGAAVGKAPPRLGHRVRRHPVVTADQRLRTGAGAALPGRDLAAAGGRPVAAVRNHRTVNRP
jgi:hypothetical protein